MHKFTHLSTLNSSDYRRPYLNLRERLTQFFVNPYTVVLALFIIKLFFFLNTLINSLENAKSQTHLLYRAIELYASNIVSFPHYVTKASNFIIAKSLTATNDGLVKSLQLLLTSSQNLIYFIIELTIGTYACLLTALVDDTAIAALNATEDVIGIANETLQSFAKDLNDGLGDLTDLINNVIDVGEDTGDALKHMFGKTSSTSLSDSSAIQAKLHHVNLTISDMQKWQISGGINDKIEKLKKDIPDFTDVQNFTETVISIPFKEMKRQVGKHLNNTFHVDQMYVAPIKQLDWSDGATKIDFIYTRLIQVAKTTTHVIMGLVGFAICVLLLYQIYLEVSHWRTIQDASQLLAYANESNNDPLTKQKFNIEVVKVMQDRKADVISFFVTEKILRVRNQILINNIRWLVNYAASPYLLSLFLLGSVGLVLTGGEYLILHEMSQIDLEKPSDMVFQKTKTEIYSNVNESLISWTNETNVYLDNFQDTVNENLFAWVDTTATTINNTVTEFDNKMNEAIDVIFKNTPLYDPIEQIVGCVIESKIKKIQAAMTWLAQNAKISLPVLDPKEIIANIDQLQDGEAADSFDENVDELKSKARKILQQTLQFFKDECRMSMYISLCILGVWFLFLLGGIFILILREYRGKNHCEYDNSDSSMEHDSDLSLYTGRSQSKESMKSERSEDSLVRISQLMHSIKDSYVRAKTGYVRTPTESNPRSQKYLGNNYDRCTHMNDAIYSPPESLIMLKRFIQEEDIKNSEKVLQSESNTLDEKDGVFLTPDNFNEGTMSVIGESFASINKARCWTP